MVHDESKLDRSRWVVVNRSCISFSIALTSRKGTPGKVSAGRNTAGHPRPGGLVVNFDCDTTNHVTFELGVQISVNYVRRGRFLFLKNMIKVSCEYGRWVVDFFLETPHNCREHFIAWVGTIRRVSTREERAVPFSR